MKIENQDILRLLKTRYFLEGEEQWDDLCKRVADAIYPPIFNLISEMKFLPSSPTLMNAGNPNGTGGLSSCFPIDMQDSIEGIGETIKDIMEITKASGGVGPRLTVLRSSKEGIATLNGKKSSGPLSYERIMNCVLNEIQQGGVRRGAGMAAYDIDHPDIIEIIYSKQDVKNNKYERFNHSIRIFNYFYEKLEKNPDAPHLIKMRNKQADLEKDFCYSESAPDGEWQWYKLRDAEGKIVSVKEIWDMIISCAWQTGEPGILNVDIGASRCSAVNHVSEYGNNPCCLTGNSKILTNKGWLEIEKIYNIVQGAEISKKAGAPKWDYNLPKAITYNLEKGKYESEKIEKCWIASQNAVCFKITLSNGKKIRCTPEHKFLVAKSQKEIVWVEAKDLKKNDFLLGGPQDKEVRYVKSVEVINNMFQVFDLETPKNHNFICEGVVIHNSEFGHKWNTSCNLGSFDLSKYVSEGKFEWNKFKQDSEVAFEFMDEVISKNKYPLKSIDKETKNWRPVGIGFMGLANALIKMGIPYASEEGRKFAFKAMSVLNLEGIRTSSKLAAKYGSYPKYDFEKWIAKRRYLFDNARKSGMYSEAEIDKVLQQVIKLGMRNECSSSIAPTGSLMTIALTSGGIEPIYSLMTKRKIEIGRDSAGEKVYDEIIIIDPCFNDYLNSIDCKQTKENLKTYILENGTINGASSQKLCSIETEKLFLCANDISWQDHLEMLAVAANTVGTSVSKSINLPNSATREEIAEIYIKAHKKGIIGVTVYRDGCRDNILSSVKKEGPKKSRIEIGLEKRPNELNAELYTAKVIHKTGKKKTDLETRNYYIALGFHPEGKIYEIFAGLNEDDKDEKYIPDLPNNGIKGIIKKQGTGKYIFQPNDSKEKYPLNGKHVSPEQELLCRSVSMQLKFNIPVNYIVLQYEKLVTKKSLGEFVNVICRYLKKYMMDDVIESTRCKNCGSNKIVRVEGCPKCLECNFQSCS